MVNIVELIKKALSFGQTPVYPKCCFLDSIHVAAHFQLEDHSLVESCWYLFMAILAIYDLLKSCRFIFQLGRQFLCSKMATPAGGQGELWHRQLFGTLPSTAAARSESGGVMGTLSWNVLYVLELVGKFQSVSNSVSNSVSINWCLFLVPTMRNKMW